MDQVRIGRFIAEKRKEKNITQKEFAERLNVTDKTVSRWENGHYLPDVSLFKKICEILDIEVIELLNGESNVKRGEVEKTIMNIIDLSDKDKKRKVSKILKISGVIICLLVMVVGVVYGVNRMKINKLQNELSYYQEIREDRTLAFPYRFAFKDIGDGWICSMNVEYTRDNLDVPYYYGYDCDNMKYKDLNGFSYAPVSEEPFFHRFYNTEPSLGYASYFHNEEYYKETSAISEYFMEKKFVSEITLDDLEELKLEKINKKDVVDLFNKVINSEMVYEYGNYNEIKPKYINESRVRKSDEWFGKEREYKFLLGYISYDGYIYYVNIDLMIDNEYLSDMVKRGSATKEQKDVYDNMMKVAQYIVDNQTFRKAYGECSHSVLDALWDNLYLVEKDQLDEDLSPYDYALEY